MNKLRNLISIAAFSLLVLSLPAIATAQSRDRDRDRDNDRYGNNGGYNNGGYNGGYGNGGYYGNGQYGAYDHRSTIRTLKIRSKEFQRQLDRDLDRSRYNGTRREDQINETAKRFRNAVNDLDNNGYYNNRGGYDSRGDNEMRRVYDLASQIERSIGRANVSYATRNLWSGIRNDLQVLSRGYGYNNGGYGNGTGGWGSGTGTGTGGWGNRTGNTNRNGLPSWWPF